MQKFWSVLALVPLALGLLSGCSIAADKTYAVPGAALGSEVVNPPAALPSKDEVEAAVGKKAPQKETTTTTTCGALTPLSSVSLELLNNPPVNISGLTSVSLTGATITKATQMVATGSLYPKAFAYLIKADLNTGETAWFGSVGDLNNEDFYRNITASSSQKDLYGATADTYKLFAWGSQNTTGVFINYTTEYVETHSTCF